jgi:hypothetical protein
MRRMRKKAETEMETEVVVDWKDKNLLDWVLEFSDRYTETTIEYH